MKIAVFGTGGVGGFFGARLARSGEDVHFIARGEHLKAIQESGLKIKSTLGNFVIKDVQVTDDAKSIGSVDLVVVSTKTMQIDEVAPLMKPLIGNDTAILPLQNGVETPEQLAQVLGRGHVLGGVCRIIAKIAAPGVIEHAGVEPHVIIGELDNARTARVAAIESVWKKAGMKIDIAEDISLAIWEKFIFMATWSGIGSVARAPIGVLRETPETRKLIIDSLTEVRRVGVALNVNIPEATEEKILNFIAKLPPKGTASMQRDVMAGRPSEYEAQSGAVVRLGQKVNVPTPIHEVIYTCLKTQEAALNDI